MTAARSGILIPGLLILVGAALAGCSGAAVTTAPASTPTSSTSPPEAAPANLDLACSGEGSPTVVLISGMNTAGGAFESLQAELAADLRVCSYSRAGLGSSPAWPADLADPSAGMAADQLLATLAASDEPGPYVMLGWSYGGLVAQAFAVQHRDLLAGLVLEDAATAELFDAPTWDSFTWAEGGRAIDTGSTADEVAGLELGSIPLVVLTQGTMEGWPDPALWTQTQDRLATLSDDVIHVVATEAGHAVHWDAEALVAKAVRDLVASVISGDQLVCDDDDWAEVIGLCRVP